MNKRQEVKVINNHPKPKRLTDKEMRQLLTNLKKEADKTWFQLIIPFENFRVDCDQDTMRTLKRHLDEGTIIAEPSTSFNKFKANESNHLNIIDDWISDYGNRSNDENFKSQLRQLRYASSVEAGNYAVGTINEGSNVTAVLVHFGEQWNSMRTYTTMSIQVRLTSSCAKDWARRYPRELAVLALSGQTSDYTLRITDSSNFLN